MTDARWLNSKERQAWLSLLAVTTLLPGALDQPLQRAARVSHFDYTVLAMLSEAQDRTLAMSELARRSNSSLSRLSHVVKKLELRGWVKRTQSAMDARVTTATMTDDGWSAIVQLAPIHVESVRQVIFDALDDEDVEALERIGEKIRLRLDPHSLLTRA
jgi:DNA-binding MarR family transcriptional regulator